MTNLTIISAVSENNVIGRRGKIPWIITDDLKHFKKTTFGHPVIMGRKTYESLPLKFRPLQGRKNIILSRTLSKEKGIHIARTIEEALELTEGRDSFIAGGEKVYETFLPLSRKIELTRVHEIYEGDAFFPKVNWDDWLLINQIKKDGWSFQTYIMKDYK